jgi:hypothetical protein
MKMEMDGIAVTLLLVLVVLLSFIVAMCWSWHMYRADQNERNLLRGRVLETERRIVELSQSVTPISAAFQAVLIGQLARCRTPEMDALMRRAGPPNLLTPEEEERLETLLADVARDPDASIRDCEREAAHILPTVIKRARRERDPEEKRDFRIVSLPAMGHD